MTNSPVNDPRQQALAQWVAHHAPDISHAVTLESLGGDAGFRRYFRFQQPSRWLAVDAPPATEDSRQFIAIADLIKSLGLSSPAIQAADPEHGFLLVEDMGDELLFRALNNTNADHYYKLAIDTLLRLQQCPDNPALIPRYDRALLRRELDIFSEWFATALLGHNLGAQERDLLDKVFHQLEDSALNQPQRFVHRDYHSRNLIVRNDGQLGIIDFQGALWGAVTYDLVSLLRDCYLRWPAGKVNEWALYYRARALELQQIVDVSEEEFIRWSDWMGLQRHIKVLGIFARLHLRDNKPGYLRDLPLVMRYTLEIANKYPELHPFADWFMRSLLPRAEAQPWYFDYQTAGDRP